jgi:enamine deaminase RidA (YjgF/YER057c/UK114 family)
MVNGKRALTDAGAGRGDVVRTTIYFASSAEPNLVAAWNVIRGTFSPHNPPSTPLGVAKFCPTDQLVGVDAIAGVSR